MDRIKFNVVLGIWQWKHQYYKYGGIIHIERKWKTVEDVLMENEVKKYMRKLVLQ